MNDRHSEAAARLTRLRAKQQTLSETVRGLSEKPELTPGEVTTFERSLDDLQTVNAQLVLETSALRAAIAGDSGVRSASGADGAAPGQWHQSDRRAAWESSSREPSQRVGNAMRGIELSCEMAEKATGHRADIAPSVRSTMERHPRAADAVVARSDPAYASAFAKLLAIGDPGRAAMSMDDAERAAFAAVEVEHRAANEGTGSAGGYGVPVLIDPSIVLLGSGAINPFRALAKTETGISNIFKGVASSGVTASWTAEGAVAADGTPTLMQPSINAWKGTAFVPFSLEIEADYESFTRQLVMLFADSQAVLETNAFSVGTGTGQPWGIQTRLLGNTYSQITSSTHGAIGLVDVHNVFAALPPRYRPNATWLGSAVTQNAIRAAGDDRLGQLPGAGYAVGSSLMPMSADGVRMMLLGKPYYESSGFADLPVGTTAAAAFLTVTDLQKSYIIFDRLNSGQVELVQHLFDPATGRPTGQRGAYYYWRVGGDVTNSSGTGPTGAMTLLNKTT